MHQFAWTSNSSLILRNDGVLRKILSSRCLHQFAPKYKLYRYRSVTGFRLARHPSRRSIVSVRRFTILIGGRTQILVGTSWKGCSGVSILCAEAMDFGRHQNDRPSCVQSDKRQRTAVHSNRPDTCDAGTLHHALSWKMENQGAGPALNVKIWPLNDQAAKQRFSTMRGVRSRSS